MLDTSIESKASNTIGIVTPYASKNRANPGEQLAFRTKKSSMNSHRRAPSGWLEAKSSQFVLDRANAAKFLEIQILS